ncbi:MAG: AI-2E family transporter, partial [Alphaproteobacteria bacterium]
IQLSERTVFWVRQSIAHPEPLLAQMPDWIANAPWLQPAISSVKSHVAEIVTTLSGFLSRQISSITHLTIFFLLDTFVTLFAFVYFLHRGPTLVNHLIERIPVAPSEARAIVDRTLTTTSAALKSIVIVGSAQGMLIGFAFAVIGIGQPWFWGTMAALASTVPGLGSGLVWLPAAAYLIVTGDITAGIGLVLWGAVVIAVADNLLRVYIVGRGASLPTFLVFISTLGGLTAFGPAGILVGPVLVGVLLGVLDLYQSVLRSSGLANAFASSPLDD